MTALHNDTCKLSERHIMYYSFLVGVSRTNGLVVGVIDYLREYGRLEAVESTIKAAGIVGKAEEPTVVPPEHYGSRFRRMMGMYFCQVPDIDAAATEPPPSQRLKRVTADGDIVAVLGLAVA